jgi:hypothetical protein
MPSQAHGFVLNRLGIAPSMASYNLEYKQRYKEIYTRIYT